MKIFGIGASKTGTTTLSKCLNTLGYSCSGWQPQAIFHWKNNNLDIEYLLKIADKGEGFTDFPWNYIDYYKIFDEKFPGSKFVLTIRNPESWFRSMAKWYTNERGQVYFLWRINNKYKQHPQRELILQRFKLIAYNMFNTKDLALVQSKQIYINSYKQRNKEITDYFKDRPHDLLTINFEKETGWKNICKFFKKPLIKGTLPHLNKSRR